MRNASLTGYSVLSRMLFERLFDDSVPLSVSPFRTAVKRGPVEAWRGDGLNDVTHETQSLAVRESEGSTRIDVESVARGDGDELPSSRKVRTCAAGAGPLSDRTSSLQPDHG